MKLSFFRLIVTLILDLYIHLTHLQLTLLDHMFDDDDKQHEKLFTC